jgi:hypothetical protein
MIETIDKTIPEGKIYKERAFWAGTYLGGPLVAGYLFAENFKTLGQPEKVKPTWIITIIATIVIFGAIFSIPDSIDIPNQLIPLIYTAIVIVIFKYYQIEEVNDHIERQGLAQGWGKIIGVGLIGLLVTVGPIFAYSYLSDTMAQANISTKTYGASVKHEVDFDKSTISEQEVDRIAEGFRETGFFDYSVAKYVYLEKNGNTYEISIAVIEGIENDEYAIQPFAELRDQMDSYLPNNKVEIKLVVEYLENVVKVLK